MAALNVDITKVDSSGSNGNGNSSGSNVRRNTNTGTIGGSAVHQNYGNVHNRFVVVNICRGSGDDDDDQDQDDGAAAPMVARVLGVIGVATGSIAAGAAAYNCPRGFVAHGRELAYFIGIIFVFVSGLAEVGAAFWVSADNQNRYGVGRKIVRAALVLLVLAVGLGGFAVVFKNKK